MNRIWVSSRLFVASLFVASTFLNARAEPSVVHQDQEGPLVSVSEAGVSSENLLPTVRTAGGDGNVVGESIDSETHRVTPLEQDRVWLISTRRLSRQALCADLDDPDLSVATVQCNGLQQRSSLSSYIESLSPSRTAVIYVHGYRFDFSDALTRGLFVYRETKRRRTTGPIDYVILVGRASEPDLLATIFAKKVVGRTLRDCILRGCFANKSIAGFPHQ